MDYTGYLPVPEHGRTDDRTERVGALKSPCPTLPGLVIVDDQCFACGSHGPSGALPICQDSAGVVIWGVIADDTARLLLFWVA